MYTWNDITETYPEPMDFVNEIKLDAKEEIVKEVEKLRIELTETIDKYSQICERLWKISHKK